VDRELGGVAGSMVSESNKQCSRRHGKENQYLCQIHELVECRHQSQKKEGLGREMEKMELGVGYLGSGTAPEVYPVV